MNENIDLTKILKDCPKGTKLYSLVHGEVEFLKIEPGFTYPIVIKPKNNINERIHSNGKLYNNYDGECILFPSKEQRDWSKFSAPWYKKERFDPKTLKPFDKVIVLHHEKWQCDLFSHISGGEMFDKYCIGLGDKTIVVPYNEDTKHLVGTTEEAPEYYRYWEVKL